MSNERHAEANLDDFDGPFFPPAVDELLEHLDRVVGPNGQWLENAAQHVEGFSRRIRATTSDDYNWFWSLEFVKDSGKVAILIPWSQDQGKTDGTQSDRSIAVYAQGVDEAAAEQVAQQFALVVERRLHRV